MRNRLTKAPWNAKLFGVCGGLGEYFKVDPLFFRIGFIILALSTGFGALLYLVLAIVLDEG